MLIVILTALGVGGATVIGALVGFLFKDISHKFSNLVVSFAAGIMLSAAVLGLVLPSIEYGGKYGHCGRKSDKGRYSEEKGWNLENGSRSLDHK